MTTRIGHARPIAVAGLVAGALALGAGAAAAEPKLPRTMVWTASDLGSGGVAAVRLSTAAAGEGFAMVAESASHADSDESARIRAEVADRVYRSLGVSPRDVHVVPAGWIPKTSSGKLRRKATTERLTRCEPTR